MISTFAADFRLPSVAFQTPSLDRRGRAAVNTLPAACADGAKPGGRGYGFCGAFFRSSATTPQGWSESHQI